MLKRRSETLKAIAAKGRECATDVLLVGSSFVGRIGLLAAAHVWAAAPCRPAGHGPVRGRLA
jgi:hypothetical protein